MKRELIKRMKIFKNGGQINFKKIDERYKDLWPEESKNWNFSRLTGDSYQKYLERYFIYFLPLCLKALKKQDPFHNKIKIFDFGCGFAPMAYAAHILRESISKPVLYSGLDIRKDAIDWLNKSYEKIDDHEFIFNDVPDEFDYITANELNHTTEDISDVGEEGNFNINFKHNIQWSSSVFTHMTKNGAQRALMSIANAADDKSAQINSWLITDDLSRLAMKTGLADRNLEHEMDGFYTNNLKSPLECTAFKEDVIYDLYKNAGLEVTSIEYGNWRNNEIANEKTGHYQDIIISRKVNA